MKGSSGIEKLYCRLLHINYQKEIFGALKGFERKAEGYIAYCPFHDDAMPTLIVNSESPGYFCFACGAHGDWVHYLMNYKAMSFSEALKSLAKAAHVRGLVSESQWKIESMRSGMLETSLTVFRAMLFSDKGKAELLYLNNRVYMGEEIEHMGLGLFPGYKETRDILEKGFPGENTADVFLAGDSDRQMLAIPYRDACGRLMGIYGKAFDNTPDDYTPLT
jgi:DNA primase